MTSDSKSRGRAQIVNTILAFLIAILSVLTGYAAFKSAEIDSTSTDNYFLAQAHLNDANVLFLERGQDIIYDYTAYDRYYINNDSNPEIAAYYLDQLSEAATASLERPDGPFDDAYGEAMYKEAYDVLAQEEAAFEQAGHDSNRAVAYQLSVLIFGVGLAFAGWASLADGTNMLRVVFTVFSSLSLILALIQMSRIPGPLA